MTITKEARIIILSLIALIVAAVLIPRTDIKNDKAKLAAEILGPIGAFIVTLLLGVCFFAATPEAGEPFQINFSGANSAFNTDEQTSLLAAEKPEGTVTAPFANSESEQYTTEVAKIA